MAEPKMDPRVIRTRKLIMDAFIQISHHKELSDITIKDITEAATVNRATFYYHFADKYELLERVLHEEMMPKVIGQITDISEINEATLRGIFISITEFQSSTKTRCMRSFDAFKSNIESIIKKELEQLFYKLLLARWSDYSEEEIRIAAVMLSWGFYGSTVNWQYHSDTPAEEYIRKAMPFITQGISLYSPK